VRANLVTANQNVAQLQSQLVVQSALAKKAPAERRDLLRLRRAVPDGPDLDQILADVDLAASRAHVQLSSVGTPPPATWGSTTAPSSSGPQSLQLALGVQGPPKSVLHFVSALDAQQRVFTVDSFSINTGGNSGKAVGSPGGRSGGAGATTVGVQTYFASAASADPASSFALPHLPGGSGVSQAVLDQQYDVVATTNVRLALQAETSVFANGHGYETAEQPGGSRLLSVASLPWSGANVVQAGQVTAIAGAVTGGRWLPATAGATGESVLVEAQSQSGACFYALQTNRGPSRVVFYARSLGGCTAEVSAPTAAHPRSGSAVAVDGALVAGRDWYARW
jgi:hypothetical protein